MYTHIKNLIIILVISIVFAGCKSQNTKEINNVKVYTEITDSIKYFSNYDNKYIMLYKYFNKKLLVYNKFSNRMQIYNENKKLKIEFSSKGKGPSELLNPTSIEFDDDGIFVLDSGNKKIAWFKENGELKKEIPLEYTALSFTKINKDIIISSLGMFKYYLYKCKIDGDSKFKGLIPRKMDYKTLDVKKIFADSYIITSNSSNIFLTKFYEDSLLTYSLEGKLISRSSRGMLNIKNPQSIQESSHRIIMENPLNLHITNDNKNNIYLLSQNPKSKKYFIYEYSQTGTNTSIYELPFEIGYFEVIGKDKFLVTNDQAEIITLVYKI